MVNGFYAPAIQMERIKKLKWISVLLEGALLQVTPIGPNPDFHDNGHSEFVNAFHFFPNQLFQLGPFLCGSLEEQLVMDLKNHLGVEFLVCQAPVDFDHRQFDEISCRALQRRIKRRALRKVAKLHLRRIDLRNWPDSAEQSLRYAGLARLGKDLVQVLLHAAIAR